VTAVLPRFEPPGRLDDLPSKALSAWTEKVNEIFEKFTRRFPQFYNPTVDATPPGLTPAVMAWPAFPARVIRELGDGPARWEHADESRDEQDEYCEWSVERGRDHKITRITFTTETPEYWEHVAQHAPDRLLELYRTHVNESVEERDLFRDGIYVRRNKWNRSTSGGLAHLVQASNNLEAAVQLTAEATVLRERSDGTPVSDRQELVACGGLGDPFRNSDPQIAEIVNDAAALGTEVTLLNPVGLYLDGLLSAGMETPDDTDPAKFWHVERGADGFAVRARFEVTDRDYVVGDIEINGRPIAHGAQVADKVRIRTAAIVKPGTHQPKRQPCVQ
jgi:hypothetical protein